LRRRRFSVAKAPRGRRVTLINLRASSDGSTTVTDSLDREMSFDINDSIIYCGRYRHLLVRIGANGIMVDDATP
jgi:hypothetical protein